MKLFYSTIYTLFVKLFLHVLKRMIVHVLNCLMTPEQDRPFLTSIRKSKTAIFLLKLIIIILLRRS